MGTALSRTSIRLSPGVPSKRGSMRQTRAALSVLQAKRFSWTLNSAMEPRTGERRARRGFGGASFQGTQVGSLKGGNSGNGGDPPPARPQRKLPQAGRTLQPPAATIACCHEKNSGAKRRLCNVPPPACPPAASLTPLRLPALSFSLLFVKRPNKARPTFVKLRNPAAADRFKPGSRLAVGGQWWDRRRRRAVPDADDAGVVGPVMAATATLTDGAAGTSDGQTASAAGDTGDAGEGQGPSLAGDASTAGASLADTYSLEFQAESIQVEAEPPSEQREFSHLRGLLV